MIQRIIHFSVKNKVIVAIGVLLWIALGVYAMFKIPVDAVPDITNNQVQIVTTSPSLSPQEVEQLITFPLESKLSSVPGVAKIRSVSRFGLSVITVIFEDDIPIMEARQLVKEQLDIAQEEIPQNLGKPQLMPITTGLGEIYQYVLTVDESHKDKYDNMELRSIQDWIVKKQLMGTKGIIDVSSFGGFLKQYEVSINPLQLDAYGISMTEIMDALEKNNENSGGSYIQKGKEALYIRTEGIVQNIEDIRKIVVTTVDGTPIRIGDVAKVKLGYPPRYGALTMDGKGETVGGITLMLKGANSSEAIANVHERIDRIQKSLPEGVHIYPYLDRSILVGKATGTVSGNLIEGGLIVIFVLVLLLGNFRAGLIVASVIPLSLLFTFMMMSVFGISANLMSLGAIDFGIVIDGAVIIVEAILHYLYSKHKNQQLSREEMDDTIISTSASIIRSAFFGVMIIVVVFLPIMTLSGIEGKMFVPMAQTITFAILGALILSVTYVPMISALFLKRTISDKKTLADRMTSFLQKRYEKTLRRVLRYPMAVFGAALLLLLATGFIFSRMGAEFVPTLEEGDLAMQVTIPPGSSLDQMIATTSKTERILKEKFPEVKHVVSKIGTAEIPTDPMNIEDADVMILLKEKSEWTSASDRETLVAKMKAALAEVPDAQFDFTQPIELRFNELISGSKNDLAIQLYGDDLEMLHKKAEEVAAIVRKIQGAGDVKIDQTDGLPQLMIRYNRDKLSLYDLDISDINRVIRSAYAGISLGTVYEGQQRYDLTVRLQEAYRKSVNLAQLYVQTPSGERVPLSEVAEITTEHGPMQISRENAQRKIAIGVNVRNRDIASFVEEIQQKLDASVSLPPGYYFEYGGQFENLMTARKRLMIAVPVALFLILFLLYLSFQSFRYALMIFVTVPLSAIGGVAALLLRGMPFSISSGIGFIALFGVAVLNGIVILTYFNRLRKEGLEDPDEIVLKGSIVRLRPVLMTAGVASLGFLPMALATSAGAEVQKPLATVVIGGLISATILTLLVLPTLYSFAMKYTQKRRKNTATLTVLLVLVSASTQAQETQAYLDSAYVSSDALRGKEVLISYNELEQKKTWRLESTALHYQFGQINSSLNDYNFQVSQPLGNFLLKHRSVQSLSASNAVLQAEIDLEKRAIKRDFMHLWVQAHHAAYGSFLLDSMLRMQNEYIQQLELQLREGESSSVKLQLALLNRSTLEQQYLDFEQRRAQYSAALQSLCGIGDTIPIDPNAFLAFEISSENASKTELYEGFHSIHSLEEALLTKHQGMVRAQRFPELSVGYFNQSLDHETNFQGGQVGLSIPLFTGNRIALQQTQNQMDLLQEMHVRKDLRHTVDFELARDWFSKVYEQFNTFQETQTAIQSLNDAAELEYSSGSINFYEYMQIKSKTIQSVLTGLNLRKEVLIAMENLNYYAQ